MQSSIVVHAFSTSTQEAEEGGSLRMPGQPGLHKENLSKKQNNETNTSVCMCECVCACVVEITARALYNLRKFLTPWLSSTPQC